MGSGQNSILVAVPQNFWLYFGFFLLFVMVPFFLFFMVFFVGLGESVLPVWSLRAAWRVFCISLHIGAKQFSGF